MCILRSVSFCCALVWHEHTVSGNMNWEKVTVASFSEGQSDFALWNRFSSKDGKEMTKEAKLVSWKATWPKLQLGSLQPTPHHTNLMVQECVISPCFRNPRDTVTPVIVSYSSLSQIYTNLLEPILSSSNEACRVFQSSLLVSSFFRSSIPRCRIKDSLHRRKPSYIDCADRLGTVHWGWWCSPGDSAALAPRSEGTQVAWRCTATYCNTAPICKRFWREVYSKLSHCTILTRPRASQSCILDIVGWVLDS